MKTARIDVRMVRPQMFIGEHISSDVFLKTELMTMDLYNSVTMIAWPIQTLRWT